MITFHQISEMDHAFHDAANAFQRLAAARNDAERDEAFAMFHAAADRYRAAKAGQGWDANGGEAA